MKKLFLIIGAPGSGKTTDATLIAKRNSDKIAHYSTGDMLRAEVASGSELGKKIESVISKGNLVSLDIIIDTIMSAINGCDKDIILIDGYPRSVGQMRELDSILSKQDKVELVSVIEVKVSPEVAKERILGRVAESEVARSDDSVEVFESRMKVYTEPLAEIERFYTEKNLLKVIDAHRSIDEIVDEMERFIKSKV